MQPAPHLPTQPHPFGTRARSRLFQALVLIVLTGSWLVGDISEAEAGKRSCQSGYHRPRPSRKERGARQRITRPLMVRRTKSKGPLRVVSKRFTTSKTQLRHLNEGLLQADAEARAFSNLAKTDLPRPLRSALERILRKDRPRNVHGPRRKKGGRGRFKSAAAFDADGTLWAGDVGEGFFQFLLDRGFYKDKIPNIHHYWRRYQAGNFDSKFTSEAFYEMMVTGLAGHEISKIRALADTYFQLHAQRIFRPMVALIQALDRAEVDVHVVSGSPLWVVEAGARYFNIPAKRVIGLEPEVDVHGKIQPRIKRARIGKQTVKIHPWKERKPLLLQPRLKGRELVLVAGDSKGDLAMLKLANQHARVLVNPKGEALAFARKTKSIIINYEPEHEALAGMGVPPNWADMPGLEPLPPKTDF